MALIECVHCFEHILTNVLLYTMSSLAFGKAWQTSMQYHEYGDYPSVKSNKQIKQRLLIAEHVHRGSTLSVQVDDPF